MKKANKIFVCCASAAFAAVLSSCGIFSSPKYQNTEYYDFGYPERTATDYAVDVNAFSSGSTSYGKQRMVYRCEGNKIENDEYNRWSSAPNRLITAYVRLAFAQQSAAVSKDMQTFSISGVLLACEADVVKKEAVLSLTYEITSSTDKDAKYNGSSVIRIPMEEVTPENFASAMSKASDQVVAELKKDMDELYQKELAAKKSDGKTK